MDKAIPVNEFPVRFLVVGKGQGTLRVFDAPLSLWGGFDPKTGKIIDVHHPGHGVLIKDCVLVLPSGRGSSSSSYILVEAARRGTAPAAFILAEPDPILALGSVVARELYENPVPVAVLAASDFDALLHYKHQDGWVAEVDPEYGLRLYRKDHALENRDT